MTTATAKWKKADKDAVLARLKAVGGINLDRISFSNKTGKPTIIYKVGYFYRHGNSPQKVADKLKGLLPDLEVVSLKDDWNTWPKDSNFIVEFTLKS